MIDINVAGRKIQLRFALSLYDDFDTIEAWDITDYWNDYKIFEVRRHQEGLFFSSLDHEVEISILEEALNVIKEEV